MPISVKCSPSVGLSICLVWLLSYSTAQAWVDQAIKPRTPPGGKSSITINMKDLFQQKQISGKWKANSSSVKVDVENGCVAKKGVFNYFSTTFSSDDPTMRYFSSGPFVAENNFLRIEIAGELGANHDIITMPWVNAQGAGSDRFTCDNMRITGIFTASEGTYKVTLKKPFSMEDQFQKLDIYIHGRRETAKNAGTMVDTSVGTHFNQLTVNFTGWYSPYTCDLTMTPSTIDFGQMSDGDVVAGVAKKSFVVDTSCKGTSQRSSLNQYALDNLATHLRFENSDTETGKDYFKTKNVQTSSVNDNLVFRMEQTATGEIVKNGVNIPIVLNPKPGSPNEQVQSTKFNVWPAWIGGSSDSMPLGNFETFGILYFELE